MARPLVLSLIQMLWDRGEANGYAHRMTDDSQGGIIGGALTAIAPDFTRAALGAREPVEVDRARQQHRVPHRRDPLPNTPGHKVLMNVAFGDHQVTNWAADIEARTIGAATHAPILDPGRWPDVDALWNVPAIQSCLHTARERSGSINLARMCSKVLMFPMSLHFSAFYFAHLLR